MMSMYSIRVVYGYVSIETLYKALSLCRVRRKQNDPLRSGESSGPQMALL